MLNKKTCVRSSKSTSKSMSYPAVPPKRNLMDFGITGGEVFEDIFEIFNDK